MLTFFGSVAVALMLVSWWLDGRWAKMVLLFALASALTAAYSALEGIYPITGIEGVWTLPAVQRFFRRRRQGASTR